VETVSGRVSSAAEFTEDQQASTSFTAVQLARLDEALTLVSRHTQLRFSHAGATALHSSERPVRTRCR
jgi:hypothetical protein